MHRSIAVVSVMVVCALNAANRPRYGGTLRVQVAEEPNLHPSGALNLRDHQLLRGVTESLVRVNERGDVQGVLATSWQADGDSRKWRFTLRMGVLLHDGSTLTPTVVAASLARQFPTAEVTALANGVRVSLPRADTGFLYLLADAPIYLDRESGVIGTGPFQIETNRPLRLRAFESHWAGRPFLDAIEFHATPTAGADLWDLSPGVSHRGSPDRLQTWTSVQSELVAIEIGAEKRQLAAFLSAAVDRVTMTQVLTQKRGEASSSLLPQWLSGYAFLFPVTRDVSRARQLKATTEAIVLAYDTKDQLARVIANRVAVNARDAGAMVQPKADGNSALRLKRYLLRFDASASLRSLAGELGLTVPSMTANPESWYAAERMILESGRIVPLMHVPVVWGYQANTHVPKGDMQRFPFESVWLTQ